MRGVINKSAISTVTKESIYELSKESELLKKEYTKAMGEGKKILGEYGGEEREATTEKDLDNPAINIEKLYKLKAKICNRRTSFRITYEYY
jgi:hypothetical protein